MRNFMLVTGDMDYETFYGGDFENNPIEKGRLYDMSSPEASRASKLAFIKSQLDEDDYFSLSDLLPQVRKPKEPTLTISQIKDPDAVERAQKEYEALLDEYEKNEELRSQWDDFQKGIQSGDQIDDNDINLIFEQCLEYISMNSEDGIKRVYFYDIEV